MRKSLLLLALMLLPLSRALAQESDVITGRVNDDTGAPVIGARVEAISAETEITRSTLTDKNGRFMINFPDGGGRYVVRITFIGRAPFVKTLQREGDEELLVLNATMTSEAIPVEGVTATARRAQPSTGRTGEQSTELSQEMLNRLPLPDMDPSTLALLASGVVATSADSITGLAGFSVAGMSDLLNQVVLDGMVLGESGLQVPQEGIRRTAVTTSTFDASRGGFAGGQVSMTSTRGNNRTAGALSYGLDSDVFQIGSASTINAYSRQNLGGSIGGPVISNTLFYNFALGVQRNVDHRFALALNDPVAATRAGVAVDTVNRFLGVLNGYGIPVGTTGNYNQLRDNVSLQFRTDWNALQRQSNSQTVSLRANYSNTNQDSTRINALDLAQHGGETGGTNRAGALTLSSRLGTNWTNALTASFNESWNDATPYIHIPEGRVRVTSAVGDSLRSTQTLVFGGNRNMPTDNYRKGLQLSNDLSFLLPVGKQLHRLKVGGMLQKTRTINTSTDNTLGSFTFNSIDQLLNDTPVRFERTLMNETTRVGTLLGGVYVGDTWRISDPLEVTAGARWDYSKLDQKAKYNPAVEQAFGRRTDVEPVARTFSPRIGFSYRLASSQGVRSAKMLSGGLGIFAGQTPTSIFATAARQTGLSDAEQHLVCIGANTPIPNWDLFMSDPGAIPTSCANGVNGNTGSSLLPTVSLIDPSQKLPSSLRAELGYRTRLPLNVNANIRYSYARGRGLWGYYDINLNDTRYFTLGNEPRPFFGNPSAIVPASGQTTLAASRINPAFGNVYDIRADRASSTHQLVTQLSGMLPKGFTLSANYTLTFARDQGSGGFRVAPTAGNPNVVEWAPSSQDRRHTLNLILSKDFSQSIEITALGQLSSGAPFTPMVAGDINGDGIANDRAFVFNPATAPDTAVANGMQRILNDVPGRIADCLKSQFGQIAGRNTCRNAWSRSLNMRASLRPNLPGLERRMTISVDASNILNGLDQLFNGSNLKGWGENQQVDSRLLEVRGYNPNNNSFIYQVNETFGQNRVGSSAIRSPFGLRINARIAIGGQPFMNNRGFGAPITFGGGDFGGRGEGGFGGRGGFGGMGGFGMGGFARGDENPDSMAARAFANPIRNIIALRDTLTLTGEQVNKLTVIADSLDAQLAVQRKALLSVDLSALQRIRDQGRPNPGFDVGGPPAEVQRARDALQKIMNEGRKNIGNAMQLARRTVTPAQWDKLPLSLRAGFATTGSSGRAFNAVGMIDRMLANPIPVLLELKDTLKLSADQVARIQAVSNALQDKLNKQREQLGKKLDNTSASDQARLFMELQPSITSARSDIANALKDVEKIMTADQWQKVPEPIRNPLQRGGRRQQD